VWRWEAGKRHESVAVRKHEMLPVGHKYLVVREIEHFQWDRWGATAEQSEMR
jgi:hypothetical protein